MAGIRLILAHAYFHIDHDIIRNVIEREVPELRGQLQEIADCVADTD